MFGKKDHAQEAEHVDSVIGAGTRIEGNVVFSGRLRIDGEIKGNVSASEAASTAFVYLSEMGRVEGAVTVQSIVTNGQIVGPVSVQQSLVMQSRAKIVGDVNYSSIEMHQGAVIDGGRLLYRLPEPEQKSDLPD